MFIIVVCKSQLVTWIVTQSSLAIILFKKQKQLFGRVKSLTHSLSHPPPPRPSRDSNQHPPSLTLRCHMQGFSDRQDSFVLTFLRFSPAECVCTPSLTHSMPFLHTPHLTINICCSSGKRGEGLCDILGPLTFAQKQALLHNCFIRTNK